MKAKVGKRRSIKRVALVKNNKVAAVDGLERMRDGSRSALPLGSVNFKAGASNDTQRSCSRVSLADMIGRNSMFQRVQGQCCVVSIPCLENGRLLVSRPKTTAAPSRIPPPPLHPAERGLSRQQFSSPPPFLFQQYHLL